MIFDGAAGPEGESVPGNCVVAFQSCWSRGMLALLAGSGKKLKNRSLECRFSSCEGLP